VCPRDSGREPWPYSTTRGLGASADPRALAVQVRHISWQATIAHCQTLSISEVSLPTAQQRLEGYLSYIAPYQDDSALRIRHPDSIARFANNHLPLEADSRYPPAFDTLQASDRNQAISAQVGRSQHAYSRSLNNSSAQRWRAWFKKARVRPSR
jgi:hypothetical protein